MKTFEVQNDLPDLPVATLKNALSLYLKSVEPLLSAEEFARTKALVEDFGRHDGLGPKLHALLVERAEKCRQVRKENPMTLIQKGRTGHPDGTAYPNNHWLENWWETYAYMSDRSPLATLVNCWQSHFASLPCEKPTLRAAWLIRGALDFKELLDEQKVPAEQAGKSTFCSAQYLRILSTTRIPGKQADEMVTFPTAKHICVERRGHWYLIENLTSLSIEQLVEQLEKIKEHADSRPIGAGIAAYTGVDRSEWAENRSYLRELDSTNEKSIDHIESAVIHLILSEETPANRDELQVLGCHGNGPRIWFDKSVSLIVCDNGCAMANLEHASADAVVPARMYLYADEYAHLNCPEIGYSKDIPYKPGVTLMPISKYVPPTSPIPSPPLKPLQFVLDKRAEGSLEKAKAGLRALIEDHRIACLRFEDFGAKTLKEKCKGISTDSFMQMALALAYYRDQNGEVPATYETATTRSFFHARTETIRSQSAHSKAFCEALERGDPKGPKLAQLIRDAGNHHRNYLRACMAGQGCDRLLLGLKLIGAENKLTHPIFEDFAYTRSTAFTLSTSQMPWAIESYPAFGAYSPNAYGVCYRLTNCDKIVAVITSRAPGKKDALRFREAIRSALRDIFSVLEANPPPPKQPRSNSKL